MPSTEDKKIENHWGWGLALLVAAIPAALWYAYVFQSLWKWYLPYELPSLKQCYGIMLIAGFLTNRIRNTEDAPTAMTTLIHWLAAPAFVWLSGWFMLKLVF